MIGRLRGRVAAFFENALIIDVQGVGYTVSCSALTLDALGRGEGEVVLWVETLVRPESFQLFGFFTQVEQAWFRLLLTVQGVGARMALNILSVLAPSALRGAILAQDKAYLIRAEGVGAKLAQRILTELKDRVNKMPGDDSLPQVQGATGGANWEDALSALGNLGYPRLEAQQALSAIPHGTSLSLEHLIREALVHLGQKSS